MLFHVHHHNKIQKNVKILYRPEIGQKFLKPTPKSALGFFHPFLIFCKFGVIFNFGLAFPAEISAVLFRTFSMAKKIAKILYRPEIGQKFLKPTPKSALGFISHFLIFCNFRVIFNFGLALTAEISAVLFGIVFPAKK